MTTRADLWARLVDAGIASGAVPDDDAAANPWYVTAMMCIAAWIAALFILGFLGMAVAGLLRSSAGSIAAGVALCVFCAWLLRTVRTSVFVAQLGIAASIAGQLLVGFGLLDHRSDNPLAWMAFAAAEIALVVAIPQYAHRALSTLAGAYAIYFAMRAAGLVALFPALIAAAFVPAASFERRAIAQDAPWRAVSAGLALAALIVIPVTLADFLWVASMRKPLPSGVPSGIGAVALALVLVVAVTHVLREQQIAWNSRAGIGALATSAVVALAAWPVPGVVVALVVLLTAYGAGRRALAGLAVAALLVAIGHYYYSVDATLLAKSAALFATGITLVAAGLLAR